SAVAAGRRRARLRRLLDVDPVQARSDRYTLGGRPRGDAGESSVTRHLFCFGIGYTARALARRLAAAGWIVGGTCRTLDKAAALKEAGFTVELFDRNRPLPPRALATVTHLLP